MIQTLYKLYDKSCLKRVKFQNYIKFSFFRELKLARSKLLNSLTDPSNDTKSIQQAAENYWSLLQGLVNDPAAGSGDSKLRKLIMFKWTNSICGNTPT